MAEKVEVVLSPQQEQVLDEVEVMVLSAISERCARCSTANFAPRRIGMAVARENISNATAAGIANQFKACTGLSKDDGNIEMCHYPQPPRE